ncbi:Protein of unknown function [Ligilactobacillus sp. WC1T17]|uniref:DUF3737 family protein n=1 Tax=Ligilactobacillus ruminis TaxID=1623 RepID=A0ABY1ABC8_9LACO|nr:Protein of unknown function [Ligilactobacillus ruminis]
MEKIKGGLYEGERALFMLDDASLDNVVFDNGESPLKESSNLTIDHTIFKWKYPLWYSNHISVDNSLFETMSRSGIWYTNDITVKNSSLQAPKLFRRCDGVTLDRVHFADAQETMWTCKNIKLTNVQINGDYFGKDSENIYLDNIDLIGNYCFDGAKNIEVHHSHFVSKDSFWNCENVTIYDSVISGEYLAWNTKNITFVNCLIESNQGLCYIDGLKMINCTLLQTDLAFEYCQNIDAEVVSDVISIKNPISGSISVKAVGEIIQDDPNIDQKLVSIKVTG